MPYNRTVWVDGQTPLNAKNLNNIENAILELEKNQDKRSDLANPYVVEVDLSKAATLTSTTNSIIERYYATKTAENVRVMFDNVQKYNTRTYSVPQGANITITYTREEYVNNSYIIKATVTLDTPWLETVSDLGKPLAKEANYGQFEASITFIKDVVDESSLITQFRRAAKVDPVRKGLEISLLASEWKNDDLNKPPYQIITSLTGITINSRVDPTPPPNLLQSFIQNGFMFVIENVDTEIKIYSIGNTPTYDFSMPVTITEVSN